MTPLTLHTFTAIADTGRQGDDGRIYVLECSGCHDRCSMGIHRIRRYQRKGLKPRCWCKANARVKERTAKRIAKHQREGGGAMPKPPKRCGVCEGMPFRRPRTGCVCGGAYEAERVECAVP
ncbi:MAG TPA: hypothetical protein VFR23_25090, partial [Jiangellaceae bacterium]|nr:hypothetical protein [Jiangellaceae bacterium]